MAHSAHKFYMHYRGTSIGLTLADTLDDLVTSGKIQPHLAMRVVENFDRSIATVFNEKVKATMHFKGKLDTYRFCDEVWTFTLKDTDFRMDVPGEKVDVDKVKIVACLSMDRRATG